VGALGSVTGDPVADPVEAAGPLAGRHGAGLPATQTGTVVMA
jgi:hypothetical protein